MSRPSISTLGALRQAVERGEVAHRTVHEEVRENLIRQAARRRAAVPRHHRLRRDVVPQLVNALLSQHNFILLGLAARRRRACCARWSRCSTTRSRSCRAARSTTIRSARSARRAGRALRPRATHADRRGCARDARYVEKLATPDVTIADMVGDIDPIKAAKAGLQLSSELTMHYGLLPRANRGIFAINELPDLAGKIQVGLFNVLQEGDVQIKGYPVRLPLDVLMAFTANPEDYTARGKIITPLKDRIGSEIRTHYPVGRADAHGDHRAGSVADAKRRRAAGRRCRHSSPRSSKRSPSRRARIAASTSAPASASVCRSRRWRMSCRMPSGARLRPSEPKRVATRHRRLRGAALDHRQVRDGIRGRAEGRRDGRARADPRRGGDGRRRLSRRISKRAGVIEWFDLGGSLQLSDTMSANDVHRHARQVQGLVELALRRRRSDAGLRAAARIGNRLRARRALRDQEDQPQRGTRLSRAEPTVAEAGARDEPATTSRAMPSGGGRKKYYN